MLHSYPSIYNLGHKAVENLLDGPVLVQEKIDGSQFSFGRTVGGELLARSKGASLNIIAPEGMFKLGVENINKLELKPGYTYRGEYLNKPKHNSLAYDRVPANNVILFDINYGEEGFLPYDEVAAEASRLGLEVVPLFHMGKGLTLDFIRSLVDTRVSILGGQKIEGIVVKPLNYDIYGVDKKVLMGKFVSEAFKEVHSTEWKKENPTVGNILDQIAATYTTPARWAKAVQHLTER